VVNAIAIIAGGAIGILLKKGIPESMKNTIMHGLSLSVILIGLKTAWDTRNVLYVIGALALGGLVGELLRIEDRLNRLGELLQRRLKTTNDGFVAAFVTPSLVFCVGAMAITGSLQAGLFHDYSTLYAKSFLDGIAAIIFGSTLGPGAMLSGVSVFLYQGAITLLAGLVQPLLTPAVTAELNAVGGLLILAIGLNLLEVTRIKIGNLLPALAIILLLAPVM
jgi:uncharacterized membrane protein YqgA involved in biofilm formation